MFGVNYELTEARKALNLAEAKNAELRKDLDALKEQVRLDKEHARLAEHEASLKAKVESECSDAIKTAQQISVENKIQQAIKEVSGQLAKTKAENAALVAENNILKKAFENLGFDVKDMKDILNKLVDGIVSKNTVHLVK